MFRYVVRIQWHILAQGDSIEAVDSKGREGHCEIKIVNVL